MESHGRALVICIQKHASMPVMLSALSGSPPSAGCAGCHLESVKSARRHQNCAAKSLGPPARRPQGRGSTRAPRQASRRLWRRPTRQQRRPYLAAGAGDELPARPAAAACRCAVLCRSLLPPPPRQPGKGWVVWVCGGTRRREALSHWLGQARAQPAASERSIRRGATPQAPHLPRVGCAWAAWGRPSAPAL